MAPRPEFILHPMDSQHCQVNRCKTGVGKWENSWVIRKHERKIGFQEPRFTHGITSTHGMTSLGPP